MSVDRRTFFQGTIATAGLGALVGAERSLGGAPAESGTSSGAKTVTIRRRIPIRYEVDVFVAGGGPSGIASSVAAARQGRSVFLAERQSCLGGMGTAGRLPIFMPFTDGVNFLAGGTTTFRLYGRACRDGTFTLGPNGDPMEKMYFGIVEPLSWSLGESAESLVFTPPPPADYTINPAGKGPVPDYVDVTLTIADPEAPDPAELTQSFHLNLAARGYGVRRGVGCEKRCCGSCACPRVALFASCRRRRRSLAYLIQRNRDGGKPHWRLG